MKKRKNGFVDEGFEVEIQAKNINKFGIFNIIDSVKLFSFIYVFLFFS